MSNPVHGMAKPAAAPTPRIPRRIVRVEGDETGPVRDVIAVYEGGDIVGSKLHAEVQRLAEKHRGEVIALEWQGNLGWVRYVTCRK